FQFIGATVFQALGRAWPALLLSMSRQIFFLIPLVLTLPLALGLDGAWLAFPLADLLAGALTLLLLWPLMRELGRRAAGAAPVDALQPLA
ncbi:MAG: hypothetical protein JW819_09720, partial [Candidatus Krumholzibacteriota bacterium]|nr:hypothetical protein [Candidatus Krumholzibacteriota bacterium]